MMRLVSSTDHTGDERGFLILMLVISRSVVWRKNMRVKDAILTDLLLARSLRVPLNTALVE